MTVRRLQLIAAVGALVLSVGEGIHAYPHLPDPMASNFGGDGAPGGGSSKQSFMMLHGATMAFWLGALLGAPLLVANAGQRFDESTRRWLRDSVGWFLVASLAFSATVTHWVLVANLETGRLSGLFAWLLAIYLGYVIVWTVKLIRRVRRETRQS